MRTTAGDREITGTTGDKDIRLRAGHLMIKGGRPALYHRVHASVATGDLNALLFGAHKSGIMRSFRQQHPEGRYDLPASVTAGELEIR